MEWLYSLNLRLFWLTAALLSFAFGFGIRDAGASGSDNFKDIVECKDKKTLGLSSASSSVGSFSFPTLVSRTQYNDQQKAVEELIERLLPNRIKEFEIVIEPEHFLDASKENLDTFQIETTFFGKLRITATSGVAAAWGFNHYLKYFCKAQISWGGRQLNIPKPLPKVSKTLKITSPQRFRYYQNVCTSSYSFVWWNWARWQQHIDWMALNGINLPLAFTGQEAIWQKVYLKLGFNQSDLDAHFTGPAFLAWGRMGNVEGWGGPLPNPSWYAAQQTLQQQILFQMRRFGMVPVLPGFAGHVPKAIVKLYPTAKISELSAWGHFSPPYCCTYFLDPQDPLFQKIGKMFIQEQISAYNGTEHIYNADSFNEMTPPSSEPSYLSASSKAVFDAMLAGDKDTIWLMQGWLFQSGWWKPPQIKALLHGVPIGKMIVLDLFAEVNPIWSRTESFYGQPFIWCMLHNFGGNLGLYGVVETVANGPLQAKTSSGSTMIGTGLTPEGIEQNEFIYGLMNEMGWRSQAFNLTEWTWSYAERRYGGIDDSIKDAWAILLRSVYNCTDSHKDHNRNIPVERPSLKITVGFWYDIKDVKDAWGYMIAAISKFGKSKLFRYDLVDVGRQALQDLSCGIYLKVVAAHNNKSLADLNKYGAQLLDLLTDMDTLLSSDSHFLLGTWLESSKALGKSTTEKSLYEFNARNQITLWGPDGNIHDYANKMWGGLTKAYYLPRWNTFVRDLEVSVKTGKEFSEQVFVENLLKTEMKWNRDQSLFPTKEVGDSLQISKKLYDKYKNMEVGCDGVINRSRYRFKSTERPLKAYSYFF